MGDTTRPYGITEREDQILRLTNLHMPTRAIADALKISPETVRVHIKNAGGKVGKSGKYLIAQEYLKLAGTDDLTQIWVKRVLGSVRTAALMIEEASQEIEADAPGAPAPPPHRDPAPPALEAPPQAAAPTRPRLDLDAFVGGGVHDLSPLAQLQVAGILTLRLLGWAALAVILLGLLIRFLEPLLQTAPDPFWRGARPSLDSKR